MSMKVGHLLESIRGHDSEEIILSFSQKPKNDNSFSNRDGLVLNFDLFFSAQGKSYKRDERYIWKQGSWIEELRHAYEQEILYTYVKLF